MLNLSVGERVGNDVENAGESGLSDLQYLVICLNDVMFLFRIHESSLFSEEPQTLEHIYILFCDLGGVIQCSVSVSSFSIRR